MKQPPNQMRRRNQFLYQTNGLQNKGHNKRKRDYYLILKGVVQQEDITLVNMNAPNIGAIKYIKKILEGFKKKIDNNIVIVEDFNMPLSTMNRPSKKKINKDIVALNDTLHQMDLIDICRTFHPNKVK